jgi:[ribosomal protein S5]-alanine N-acetyltransferase
MTPRVRLVKPSLRWLAPFVTAVRRSGRLHARWVAPPSTPAAYRAYLDRLRRPAHAGYLVCLAGSRELVGVVNISEIVRSSFQSGYLGYYAFEPHARQGLMAEGLSLVVDDAFRRLGLHRLEANIQPSNARSLRLVRRLGFQREGYSPRYLRVAGVWRDHERWAILADGHRRQQSRTPARRWRPTPAVTQMDGRSIGHGRKASRASRRNR